MLEVPRLGRSRAGGRALLAAAIVAGAAILRPGPVDALTRCEVIDAAQRWVDAGVMYSWDAWYTDPTTGRCCYRTDCSAFVSAVWQLPPPGHTTYSFAGGPWDDGASYVIDPSELEPGDALNYPGSPSAGTGHVMLYVSGDFRSGWVEVYEEYGHGHPAVRRWRSIDTSLYLPIRLHGIEPCCEPHCEGDVIVSEDCSTGDCSVYGSSCVDDALGVRCVFFACPPVGTADVCVSDSVVGSCVDGALVSQGDCGAYGAYCSSAGGQTPHCASVFCVASPTDVPAERDVCLPDGDLYHCDGAGGLAAVGCPEGERCSVHPEAHCEAGLPCPAEGETLVCSDDAVVRCMGGGIVEVVEDCAASGGLCDGAAPGAPSCVVAEVEEPTDDEPPADLEPDDGEDGEPLDETSNEASPVGGVRVPGVEGAGCACRVAGATRATDGSPSALLLLLLLGRRPWRARRSKEIGS